MRKVSFVLSKLSLSKLPASIAIAAIFLLAGCQTGLFAKQPVPEPRYIPQLSLGKAQQLTVLPTKEPCNSALPMLCMIAKNQSGELFQIPYNWVEGFSHTNGVEYVINVKPKIDDNKQQMTGKWTLQNVVSQKTVIN